VNSNLAAYENGGGCSPSDIVDHELGQIVVLNPEWAPVMNGRVAASDPVTVHANVVWMHGDTGGDFPGTHVRSDVNAGLELDPEDLSRLATGNMGEQDHLELEWEADAWPAWAWPGGGDRIVAMGRWIFDCGHPNPSPRKCTVTSSQTCSSDADCAMPACPTCTAGELCGRVNWGYESELHPPEATAVIRSGRGAIVSSDPGAAPVLATIADVFASPFGGGAGDACVLQRWDLPSQLITDAACYPLSHPIARFNAQDLVFDLPLPPKPAGASTGDASWRIVPHDVPGGVPADIDIESRASDPSPHLAVRVKLSQPTAQGMPTGFGSTILAGWKPASTPLTHVRVTVNSVSITNPLKPFAPVVRDVRAWRLQVSASGEWQWMTGLDSVSDGAMIPQNNVFDQYYPADGKLEIVAEGTSEACIDTLFGKSIQGMLQELGFSDMLNCIQTTPSTPGDVDITYPGPDFGAGPSGSKAYQVASQGAPGGRCSATARGCIDDRDCPTGEMCQATGTAFTLSYTIERVP
jgi:hypothetical protein